MRRTAGLLFVAALLPVLPATGTGAAPPGARVIVSSTLNDSLQIFDATTFAETQPPVFSRGGGPVRLWLQNVGGKDFLLAANHGVPEGSVGIFDLSGDLVVEAPLSPAPARPGSVGVTGGVASVGLESVPVVFVTNTYHALGGCGMPKGNVTAYDGRLLQYGLLREIGTVDTSGSIPYAVSFDGRTQHAFVTNNCSDTVDVFEVRREASPPARNDLSLNLIASQGTGDAPDGTMTDPSLPGLAYVANIGGGSIDAFDTVTGARLTTVRLPGAHPIDVGVGDDSGYRFLFTSNGDDDSVGILSRDLIHACAQNHETECAAELLRVKTGVPGGAPEGIAYDPATHRIFSVNKTLFDPSLSVIQLTIEPGAPLRAEPIATIPLRALNPGLPVPSVIAFDVVVQPRS